MELYDPEGEQPMTSSNLTHREEQVLRALLEDPDRTALELGDLVGVSEATARVYLARLRIKAGVTTKAGLVGWAYQVHGGQV